MSTKRIYVASSWRNPHQPDVVSALREVGFQVYDFRHPRPDNEGFAWSEIDADWQAWDAERFRTALAHPVAERGYSFDFEGMQWADTCVLVLPSGRSAHIEAGWMAGTGRRLYILTLGENEPELMYKLAAGICLTIPELLASLREVAL